MKGPWGALLCYLVLAMLAFYPISTRIDRYALAHRTASKHAVGMYALGDYFEHIGRRPLAYLDTWAYPDGGMAKPLAVPSLAAGSILCKFIPPRTAFNVVLLANLVLSGFAFYLVGKRLGFANGPATGLGALAVFHPLVHSFILRGQIENTMLWTVGFSLLAGLTLLTEPRWNLGAFAGASLLPLLIVVSTPYYAMFYLLLCPVVLLFVMADRDVGWRFRYVPSYLLSWFIAAFLLAAAVRFYAPAAGENPEMLNLHPGSLEMGIGAVARMESPLDLVRPRGLLRDEKPFLGLALLAAAAWGATTGIRDGRRRGKTLIALAGAAGFAVLAMGRAIGSVSLPAAFLDRLWPEFRGVAMLFRALPFMAICVGLLMADNLSGQRPRRAGWLLTELLLLIVADGLLVSPPWERTRGRFYLDQETDMDRTVAALPQRHAAHLPVVDLPPHRHDSPELWAAYTYYQTEHGQKLVWCNIPPRPLPPLMRTITDMFDVPESLTDVSARNAMRDQLREANVGLIVLHRRLVEETNNLPDLEALLDACFPRRAQSDSTVVWQVAGRRPPAF